MIESRSNNNNNNNNTTNEQAREEDILIFIKNLDLEVEDETTSFSSESDTDSCADDGSLKVEKLVENNEKDASAKQLEEDEDKQPSIHGVDSSFGGADVDDSHAEDEEEECEVISETAPVDPTSTLSETAVEVQSQGEPPIALPESEIQDLTGEIVEDHPSSQAQDVATLSVKSEPKKEAVEEPTRQGTTPMLAEEPTEKTIEALSKNKSESKKEAAEEPTSLGTTCPFAEEESTEDTIAEISMNNSAPKGEAAEEPTSLGNTLSTAEERDSEVVEALAISNNREPKEEAPGWYMEPDTESMEPDGESMGPWCWYSDEEAELATAVPVRYAQKESIEACSEGSTMVAEPGNDETQESIVACLKEPETVEQVLHTREKIEEKIRGPVDLDETSCFSKTTVEDDNEIERMMQEFDDTQKSVVACSEEPETVKQVHQTEEKIEEKNRGPVDFDETSCFSKTTVEDEHEIERMMQEFAAVATVATVATKVDSISHLNLDDNQNHDEVDSSVPVKDEHEVENSVQEVAAVATVAKVTNKVDSTSHPSLDHSQKLEKVNSSVPTEFETREQQLGKRSLRSTPLEAVLLRRYDLMYEQVFRLVADARTNIGASKGEPWTDELYEECEKLYDLMYRPDEPDEATAVVVYWPKFFPPSQGLRAPVDDDFSGSVRSSSSNNSTDPSCWESSTGWSSVWDDNDGDFSVVTHDRDDEYSVGVIQEIRQSYQGEKEEEMAIVMATIPCKTSNPKTKPSGVSRHKKKKKSSQGKNHKGNRSGKKGNPGKMLRRSSSISVMKREPRIVPPTTIHQAFDTSSKNDMSDVSNMSEKMERPPKLSEVAAAAAVDEPKKKVHYTDTATLKALMSQQKLMGQTEAHSKQQQQQQTEIQAREAAQRRFPLLLLRLQSSGGYPGRPTSRSPPIDPA